MTLRPLPRAWARLRASLSGRADPPPSSAGMALPFYTPAAGLPPPPAGDFVLLVPGTAAPVVAPDLPAALTGAARDQVARRQLADATGLPTAALELRPLPAPPRRGWSRAVLCDAGQATAWRGQRDALGSRCRAILPDYLGLPAAAGLWVVQVAPARDTGDAAMVLARLGPDDGFTAEAGLAALLLEKARPQPPRGVLRLGAPEAAIDAVLAGLGVPVAMEAAGLAQAGLPLPHPLAHGELTCDLGRDPAAAARLHRRRFWRWTRVGLFSLLALALWSGAVLIRIQDLRQTTLALRAETTALARAQFVPNGPILDVRLQVQSALRGMQAAAEARRQDRSALDLLRAAGLVIADHAARPEQASALPGGGLGLTLALPDFAALDRLVAGLAAAGLTVRITGASARSRPPGEGGESFGAPPSAAAAPSARGITALLTLLPKEGP